MSEPFLGQVMLTSFGYAPRGYALCDGATMHINQNQALFSLLGTSFGGDGQTTFNLPDLRGRVPIHAGAHLRHGDAVGEATVTLSANEMPPHSHQVKASDDEGDAILGGDAVLATPASPVYRAVGEPVHMTAETITETEETQPHPNLQPYTVINYCIAVQGYYPQRD